MNVAQQFGANYRTFGNLSRSTLINMLALSEGDEEEFIATQVAAGKPVEKQSAHEVQKNVKAFKQTAPTSFTFEYPKNPVKNHSGIKRRASDSRRLFKHKFYSVPLSLS